MSGGASSKEGCLVVNEKLEIVAVNSCADMDWAFNELTLRTSKYCLNNFSSTLHKHCIKVIRETIDQVNKSHEKEDLTKSFPLQTLSTQFTRSTLQTSIRNPLTGIRHKCTVGLEIFCYPNLQSSRTSSNLRNEPIVEIVLHIKKNDPKLEPENMPEHVGGTQSEDSFALSLNKKEIMNFRTEAEEKPVVRTLFSPNSLPSKSTTRMVDSSSLRLLSFAGSKKSPHKQILRSSEVKTKEVNKEDIGKEDSIHESSIRNNNFEKVQNIEHISNTQQTGRGSVSTIAQISLKSKINHVIDKQEKLYVRSELFCMVFLQILIWSMSTFSTVYMNNKSNIEMQKMIEVRSGFAIIVKGFSNMFNSGTMLLNHMFVQRGYISTTKYSQFNKNSQTNFLTEAEKSIQRSTDTSRQLKTHIFSFDIERASKFLKQTAKYVSWYNEDKPESTFTTQLNIVKIQRAILLTLHKWKARINNIDFYNYLLEDFTKLMGPLWEVVAVGTMVWIIDTESVEFEAAVKTQINTIISTTCVSLLLMLVVFYISWLIRAKIDQVYSVFSHLHEEEVEREIQRLSNIGESLGTVCIQEQQFYKEVFMMYFIKKTEHQNNAQAMSSNFNGSQKKSNTSIMARAYRSNTCRIKSSGFFGRFHCYNIGTFIFVIGVMMLAFSTTSLLILDRVSSNNKEILDLMKLYRKFGTSNASLNFINFRMYLGVLVQSGLGANFVTFDNNYQYFNTFVNRFAAFEREYDQFATQEVPRKGKFTANFASMIDEKPCNYVDK